MVHRVYSRTLEAPCHHQMDKHIQSGKAQTALTAGRIGWRIKVGRLRVDRNMRMNRPMALDYLALGRTQCMCQSISQTPMQGGNVAFDAFNEIEISAVLCPWGKC
jgi:hypothetical protein